MSTGSARGHAVRRKVKPGQAPGSRTWPCTGRWGLPVDPSLQSLHIGRRQTAVRRGTDQQDLLHPACGELPAYYGRSTATKMIITPRHRGYFRMGREPPAQRGQLPPPTLRLRYIADLGHHRPRRPGKRIHAGTHLRGPARQPAAHDAGSGPQSIQTSHQRMRDEHRTEHISDDDLITPNRLRRVNRRNHTVDIDDHRNPGDLLHGHSVTVSTDNHPGPCGCTSSLALGP